MWNEGEKPERYDWHEGTCISPPAGTWHQHYNTGNQPCKFVALHANTAVQKEEKGVEQLEFEEVDESMKKTTPRSALRTASRWIWNSLKSSEFRSWFGISDGETSIGNSKSVTALARDPWRALRRVSVRPRSSTPRRRLLNLARDLQQGIEPFPASHGDIYRWLDIWLAMPPPGGRSTTFQLAEP